MGRLLDLFRRSSRYINNKSGRWLAHWLEMRLIGGDEDSTSTIDNLDGKLNHTIPKKATTTCLPKNRLACLALIRALL